ncbi:MAG: hypothetical protein Q8R92_13645 [Deltaproteobacteria bacterium]|nr:hypothetical protein [Deltaproteobacteria bacterium]
MRPPDPSQPVLYSPTRHLAIYRYVLPLFAVMTLGFVAWSLPAGVREILVPYLLPVAVFIGGLLLHARNLRAGTITEPGIVVSEGGADYLVEWNDIEWATELWMNPPTLVVRLKPGLPILPPWFLLLPPRERRYSWSPQPMSQFVAQKTREARAERPEPGLEHGRWPSRARLTLRVTGTFFALFVGSLMLATWLYVRELGDALPIDRHGEPLHVIARSEATKQSHGNCEGDCFVGPCGPSSQRHAA